jgi:hypothetical protein
VPNTVTLSQPSARTRRECAIKRGKSMAPFSSNGVEIAQLRPKRVLDIGVSFRKKESAVS